jgi:drug/metabolite transporter (DMT)-like permease
MATPLWVIGVILATSFIGAIGQYCFKKASKDIKFNIKNILSNRYLIVGVIVYALGAGIWILLLPFGELSSMYPFVAIVYVWVAFVSKKYLHEKMNIWKWLGIASIIAGVAFVGFGI